MEMFSLDDNLSLLALSRKLRDETLENLQKQLYFVYMLVNEDFPWESEDFLKIEEKNLGFCEDIVFSNIGSYPFSLDSGLCKFSINV